MHSISQPGFIVTTIGYLNPSSSLTAEEQLTKLFSVVPQQAIRTSGYKSSIEIGGADWIWCYVPGNMRRKILMTIS